MATKSCKLLAYEVTDRRWWDESLVDMHGAHPLQSWAWGEAKQACGARVLRLAVTLDARPLLMAQAFLRKLPLGVVAAWIPRGPAVSRWALDLAHEAGARLKGELRRRGVHLLISQTYGVPLTTLGRPVPFTVPECTFCVDLSVPLEVIDKRVHKEWRYGKNRFQRDGGKVWEETGRDSVEGLIAMYNQLVARKQFRRYGSDEFIRQVWASFRRNPVPAVSAHLFQAESMGRVASYALILKVGAAAHYMWGASAHELRKTRANEGVQWFAMQALREIGTLTYDLGGVDLRRNPGVYEFKARMGGTLVTYPVREFCILMLNAHR